MSNPNDPHGCAAERIAANAKAASLATQISAYSGDQNGRADLAMKQQDLKDRLNLSSTSVGHAYSGFGLERIST